MKPIFSECTGLTIHSAATIIFHRKACRHNRLGRLFVDTDEVSAESVEQALLSIVLDHPREDYHALWSRAVSDLKKLKLDATDLEAMLLLLEDTLTELALPAPVIADAVAQASTKLEDLSLSYSA